MSYCSNVNCSDDACTKHGEVALKVALKAEQKPVIIAVDGSSFSVYAVRWALHMFEGNFVLVHAYDFVPVTLGETIGGSDAGEESRHAQAELAAYRVLRSAEVLFEESGRATSLLRSLVVRGEARNVVVNLVKQFDAEVLIVGSRGKTGVSRMLGSVSDYLLHHAPCHVCIVHPPPEIPALPAQSLLEMLVELPKDDSTEAKMEAVASKALPAVARTIFLALDGSEQAQKAFEWTRDHFLKKGDQVVFIMAYIPSRERSNSLVGWASLFGPPTFSFGQTEEEGKKAADTVCTRMKEYAARLGKETRAITGENARLCLQTGDARDVIQNITEHSGQVDVLVMGSRGRGLVKRAILGSVVDHVATHSNCSLMVVK